jgi:hypothetical protein
LVIGSILLPAAAGAQEAAKPYTLFMGADISVGQGKELGPVIDVSGASWVIDVGGKPALVSAKSGPINMKIASSPKLAEIAANISKLKADRAYTFDNDPSVRLTRSMNEAATLNAGYHAAASQTSALNILAIATQDTGGNASSATSGQVGGGTGSGARGLSSSSANLDSATSSGAGWDLFFKPSEAYSGGYDALDVSFDVSAGRRLSDPYVVIITRFHERGAEAGTFKNLVYAKALNPVDSNAASVHLQQTGFPPGFEPLSFEIHLYNHGDEVATNVAPKHVDFTSEQAFDYVKTRYLEAHKDQTLPAVPVMGRLPDDLGARLAAGKYGGTFYVRVSREGLANEPFLNADCTKRIEDPYLESVVRGLRFKPALERGRPVDGVASLNLSQLRL